MQKTYISDAVTFGYNKTYQKWVFKTKNSPEILVACAGQVVASKVANIINGAIQRTGGMDNMARANIYNVIHG